MRKLHFPMLALSLTALVSCKAIDAMDNTETMKTDLAAMKQTTGGMAGTTEGMKSTTEELKRKASVGEGLKLIDAQENQKEFAPPSKGLLAGAKLVAENMTTEELVKFFQAGLKEIRKTTPSEIEADRSQLGGYSARYVFDFNRKKEVQIVTLEAIAAQIPQATLEKIIQEQFQGGGGAQSDEAKDLLMLRAKFINEFFLAESMFATGKKIDNLGKLRNAMEYTRQLQFIADFASATEIGFRVEEGVFLPPVLPAQKAPSDPDCLAKPNDVACVPSLGEARVYDERLDLNVAKPWFAKIAKRIDKDMPESMRGSNSTYAREIAEIKEECLRRQSN